MSVRFLSERPLLVSPALRGVPLASPLRRALALGVDWAILVLPSVAVALAAALVSLRLADPAGYAALRALWSGSAESAESRGRALGDLAPLLVRLEAPGLPAAVAVAVEEGDRARAGRLLADADIEFSLAIGPHAEKPLPPGHVRFEFERLIPEPARALALFGVAAAYFTLLSGGRRGATVGKRLLGIRIVRLDGHPLSLAESFERFVGYLHIPASLGLSLLDLWRDPNRRMPHDRVVHTAVIRLRVPPATEIKVRAASARPDDDDAEHSDDGQSDA